MGSGHWEGLVSAQCAAQRRSAVRVAVNPFSVLIVFSAFHIGPTGKYDTDDRVNILNKPCSMSLRVRKQANVRELAVPRVQ